MSVAEKMKAYVAGNGLKQNVIAKKANMRPDSFSRILKGKRKVTVGEYIDLCDAMGVSPATFIENW